MNDIVPAGKAMVPPRDFIYFQIIIKNISNRNFVSELVPVDAECFKLYVYMYFDPKRSCVACTGHVICKICSKKLTRKSQHHRKNSSQYDYLLTKIADVHFSLSVRIIRFMGKYFFFRNSDYKYF